MESPQKRKLDKMELSEMRESGTATVHGVLVGEGSPVKTTTKAC